ncbi:hypothetical protein [Arthrobacter sp. B3I4]|uniref:hypothetical protein n=1 Tax=Arthrobacter sp. B3I4 TaxID=3042267 RepID=UPI0027809111|nr:hypothetical protein [Arthrobacter sp. B3I4]MDQ0755438.1 hypothetical protein [Arthrobacter sp. B3I4]
MPGQFYLSSMLLVGPLLAAMIVYAVLRWVVWAPNTGTSPASVSTHALWVGVIGWLASSLQGAANVGIIPGNPYPGGALTSSWTILPALGWPILGCLGVHALGQVSYPGPRRLRREAVLSVRRIRDFLPRRLAAVTAAIFAAAGAFIATTATLPGFPPVLSTTTMDGPYTRQSPGADGRIPGPEVALWLSGALAVLAGGTWLVLWLIASRRQLEALDAADNAVLRTIAMNRLLRTVATVAAGLGSVAGNFAARPDPSSGGVSWTNPASFAGMAVLLAMWIWKPPRIAAAGPAAPGRPVAGPHTGGQHPAARLVSSLGPLLGLAAAVPLLAGVLVVPGLMAAAAGLGMAGFVTLMAAMVLLVLAGGELLLQRNYGAADAPRGWPRQPVSRAWLTTAILALLTFLLALAVTATGRSQLQQEPEVLPVALLTAAGAAAAVPAFAAARLRQGVPALADGMDAALRAITVHRAVRTLAALFVAQAAVLLLTQSPAWAAVFVAGSFGEPINPSSGTWWPATLAGAILGSAATVIAVVPLTGPVRSSAGPAPRRDRETVA